MKNNLVKPEENENKQIEAIAEIFKKHFTHFGFKKTSVDDVAKELKMSKKTIYKFFSTKEKIFYFIISQVAIKMCKQMENEISSCKTGTEKISMLVTLIFQESKKWIKEGNDAFEFKYKFEIAGLAFKDAYNLLFSKIIQEGVDNGEFVVQNIPVTISFINGIFSESMKLLQSNPESDIENSVNDAIIRLLK